jgi:simple sugar transport system ATP-binding protein
MVENIVEMENIIKNFGLVHAVKTGNFNLRKGEIHSLIGENGAGKSTMMKLLYGMYPIDGGSIKVRGQLLENLTPKIAIENGIGMVHQEFMLVENLTVLENIILGFEPTKGSVIDFDLARKTVTKFIEQYGMNVQLNKKVHQISVGEAQRVEIIKILTRGAEVIILDEPTAVLTPQEADRLFEIMENLKNDGKSIIFISHKLNEVMKVSDRITVMRHGDYMGTVDKKDTSPSELAKMMIGREVFLDLKKEKATPGEVICQVKDLWTSGNKETSKVRGISFEVRAGEIVGLAGIDGNGQSELIEAITGLRKIEKGSVILDGKDITNMSPKKIRKSGMTHIPEDRNLRGLNRQLTIKDNLLASRIDDKKFKHHFLRKDSSILEESNNLIGEFDIRPTDPETLLSSLSGGNAQKIVVAREISTVGNLLVAAQPTRGVDIGAIESIRSIIQEQKKKGIGIILVSADLEEIISLSDRIIVIHEGHISGKIDVKDANEENLGLLMMGGKDTSREGLNLEGLNE